MSVTILPYAPACISSQPYAFEQLSRTQQVHYLVCSILRLRSLIAPRSTSNSFIIIFPLHLTLLSWYTGIPAQAYLAGLKAVIHERLIASSSPSHLPTIATSANNTFPTRRFVKTIAWLTLGISGPALLWYIAVSLTSYVPSVCSPLYY